MEYYAAALREDGSFCRATDGLMVKGYKLCDGEKLVVMAHCDKESSAKCSGRKRRGFLTNRSKKKVGQRTDYVIRKLEECCEELYVALNIRLVHGKEIKGNEVEDFLEEFVRKILKKRNCRKIEMSVICFYGKKLFAFSNSVRGIFILDNRGMSEMKGFRSISDKGLMAKRGVVTEGQTILVGSDSFLENVSKGEIHMNLCPQMCMDNETMKGNLEELAEIVRGRNGGRAFSALALCIARNR